MAGAWVLCTEALVGGFHTVVSEFLIWRLSEFSLFSEARVR
jgi:hypothetical protein